MSILKLSYKAVLTLLISAVAILSSCDAMHEEMPPCPKGLSLRFVYDYNMEYANAFPSQVDCLTLLVYDEEGNHIRTLTAGRPETADEDWRLTTDLPSGTYRLLAYGGMECDKASFTFSANPAAIPMRDLEVQLAPSLISEERIVRSDLHPLFYGRLEVTVPQVTTAYTEDTVYMMKDTNDIRVLLANENGLPVDAGDFVFSITDNNTRYNYLNDIISTAPVTYRPWTKGNSPLGLWPDGTDVQVAWAEFSVGRLMDKSGAELTVRRISDGGRVLSIPLVNVLELYKSDRYSSMPDQEFLDRESRWNMTFFLTDGVWAGVSIVINDWVVRINNISDL